MDSGEQRWQPENVDVTRPSPARVYDAWLGGAQNFAADRAAADAMTAVMPELPAALRANRVFLSRVVRTLAEQGVDQFLDLGSGLPTVGNVHEVATAANPAARVVYVDIDPVAFADAERLLAEEPRAEVIQADLRDPAALYEQPRLHTMLDFSRPVAVLMLAVLHFIPDDEDPAGIVADYLRWLPAGSYLAISHATTDTPTADTAAHVQAATENYQQSVGGFHLRSRDEITALFAGTTLLEPGLCAPAAWRATPDQQAESTQLPGLAGLGFVP